MIIGVLQVELHIGDAANLKDKRRVLNGLKDRIGRSATLAIAEVDENETHQTAVLGIVAIANETPHVQSQLSGALEIIKRETRVILTSQQTEILSGM